MGDPLLQLKPQKSSFCLRILKTAESNWLDWKYIYCSWFSSFTVKNMRRHNANDECKPYGGRHRKNWIDTSITTFIFNPFSFT